MPLWIALLLCLICLLIGLAAGRWRRPTLSAVPPITATLEIPSDQIEIRLMDASGRTLHSIQTCQASKRPPLVRKWRGRHQPLIYMPSGEVEPGVWVYRQSGTN